MAQKRPYGYNLGRWILCGRHMYVVSIFHALLRVQPRENTRNIHTIKPHSTGTTSQNMAQKGSYGYNLGRSILWWTTYIVLYSFHIYMNFLIFLISFMGKKFQITIFSSNDRKLFTLNFNYVKTKLTVLIWPYVYFLLSYFIIMKNLNFNSSISEKKV